jgi:hypothetical protein
MTTTFQSRELVRDELVALFTADNSWNNVYGYFPAASEMVGKTPILLILSDGTRQSMDGVWSNPANYQFLCISFVLADSDSDNWTVANANDKVDDLDRVFRQIVRTNAGSLATANLVRFGDGFSVRRDVSIGGKPYISEERTIICDVIKGTMA